MTDTRTTTEHHYRGVDHVDVDIPPAGPPTLQLRTTDTTSGAPATVAITLDNWRDASRLIDLRAVLLDTAEALCDPDSRRPAVAAENSVPAAVVPLRPGRRNACPAAPIAEVR